MYFLGVDGGGSKTTAVLSDLDGKVVRTNAGGPANVAVLDKETLAQLVKEIIQGLLGDESVDKVRWATFGLAGAGRQEEKQAVQEILAELGLAHFSVMTDAELLYYAIHGDRRGILISAGTGSIAILRNRQSVLEQLGGWGYLLGDEGSGFDVGRMAIRAVLKAVEKGQRPSELTHELLAFYQVARPQDLVTRVYSAANPQQFVASCAKLVCEQALQGEPNARGIVEAAAGALIQLAVRAVERLDSTPPYTMALAGSLLSHNSPVAKLFKEKAKRQNLSLQYKNPVMPPAAAGVLHSVSKAGEPISQELVERMRRVRF
ncbi:MAG: BadF/BadG/BcrA/BcrD ATPase family protein [bacterium]